MLPFDQHLPSKGSVLRGPVSRDTARLSQRYPPIARYGVFGVSTWPIGCDTPSPFSECFPLGEHAKWRCDTPPPPHKRGISAIPARYPMKTRKRVRYPALRYYTPARKDYIHKFLFSELLSRKITFQLQEIFLGN